MKKFAKRAMVVTGCIAMLSAAGCAGWGVWSPGAQAVLTQIVAYYNQYVQGVEKDAPAILAEAESLFGANSKVVTDAKVAVTAVEGALSGLNQVAQAGANTNVQETNVQAAIQGVNQTVGAVKDAVAQAKAATVPAATPVPTASKAQ